MYLDDHTELNALAFAQEKGFSMVYIGYVSERRAEEACPYDLAKYSGMPQNTNLCVCSARDTPSFPPHFMCASQYVRMRSAHMIFQSALECFTKRSLWL